MAAAGEQRGGAVLVVDDDRYVCEIVTAILRPLGYVCATAADGREAVAELEKNRYDVVVTDMKMPRLDGMGLLRHVKKHHGDTDVLVITGHSDLYSYSEIIDAGGIDFVIKPFGSDELEAKINRIFRERNLIRGLEREIAERRQAEKALIRAKREAEAAYAAKGRLIKDLYVIMDEMLANRDHYTFEHALRVAEIAKRVGERMGLGADDLEALEQACLVHDIGKVAIPDDVLLKPGHFAQQDRDIMRLHPLLGANLFAQRQHDPRIVFIIRHHHERLDGSGYPDGLAGGELGLLVRIASAADVYEALVARRPYKKPLSRPDAADLVRAEARNGRLDPEVVAVLRQVVDQWDPLSIRREFAADYLGELEIFRTMTYFREPLSEFYNYRYIYFLDDIQVLKRTERDFCLMMTTFLDLQGFYQRTGHTVTDQIIDEIGQQFHDTVEAFNLRHGNGECLARMFRKGSNYLFYLEGGHDLFARLRDGLGRHLRRLEADWGLASRGYFREYPKGHGLERALNELFKGE